MIQVYHKVYASIFNLVHLGGIGFLTTVFIDLGQQAKCAYFELIAETILLRPDLFPVFISAVLLCQYWQTMRLTPSIQMLCNSMCDTFCIKGHSCDP